MPPKMHQNFFHDMEQDVIVLCLCKTFHKFVRHPYLQEIC